MSPIENHTSQIKAIAHRLGFDYCGIAKAEFLEEEAPRLEKWLSQGMHGKMSYMENHFDKRLDPTKLVEGAQSVVSLLYNYFPEEEINSEDNFKIAKYAYGKDYHFVIKDKLKEFFSAMQEEIGEVGGRVFVDSAPVHERAFAAKAGLGWVGKNSLLINKGRGSFFFLAELIIVLKLIPDNPIGDYCGTCTRCMDACPTDAIPSPYVVDGSKCISYLTIELKEDLPSHFKENMEDWIFGCDICQDVCPWNRFSKKHDESSFNPNNNLQKMKKSDWRELTNEVFNELFKKSPVKRTKFSGLVRNIQYLSK